MTGPTKNVLFRIVTPCRLVERHQHYGEICYLHNFLFRSEEVVGDSGSRTGETKIIFLTADKK
jgi:hypothetical protein